VTSDGNPVPDAMVTGCGPTVATASNGSYSLPFVLS
jgi:hypothetical protein